MQVSSGIEHSPLSCPDISTILPFCEELQIEDNEIAALIYSIAELADAGKAKRMDIYIDHRQLPNKSLLHTKLADYSGPALCFYLPGTKPACISKLPAVAQKVMSDRRLINLYLCLRQSLKDLRPL